MNRAQRRIGGYPQKMNYASMLAQKRAAREQFIQTIKDEATDYTANTRMQRLLWMAVCALGEEFRFGKDRTKRFLAAVQEIGDEYARMLDEVDAAYADEKLRQRAEQVSGIKVGYLYEDDLRKIRELKGEQHDTM